MSRYDSFEMFMVDVVTKAKELGVNQLYDNRFDELIDYCIKMIKYGWWVFAAVCVLLVMGPIAFGVSIASFLLTPPGLIIGGIFGVAVASILRNIYKNKELPLAIKKIGEKYEKPYLFAKGNNISIDRLYKSAVDDLMHGAKKTVSGNVLIALNNFLRS